MAKAKEFRASKTEYISPRVNKLLGFETPFENHLDSNNRWVVLAELIPWDMLVGIYRKKLRNRRTGAGGINPRVAIGSLIIKHLCSLSDRDTVQTISENIYMQYFIGYSSFSNKIPFDASLFVDLRKRLDISSINEINEQIMKITNAQDIYGKQNEKISEDEKEIVEKEDEDQINPPSKQHGAHKGTLIIDATACPQDIKYPTDLDILNDSREKSEDIIDLLYELTEFITSKPRTYRKNARKKYLKIAQKKKKTRREIRYGIRQQLQYLKRNIHTIHKMLDQLNTIPLDNKMYKYLLVIQTAYEQQKKMYDEKTHSVDNRIVSIHQPHVRPIVRGKANALVEFGSKIVISLTNGISFLEVLSWEAFNEGTFLVHCVDSYKKRTGHYPQEILVDRIFCTRANRSALKSLGIILKAKPLGRPSLKNKVKLDPGERNPIEGKFGQAKSAYGMNRIKARLDITSASWIASIVLVLNLVKLAESYSANLCIIWSNLLALIQNYIKFLTKSCYQLLARTSRQVKTCKMQIISAIIVSFKFYPAINYRMVN